MPDVSVVIPTCGRPALLERCLAALEKQTLDPARFEVIVVDDTEARSGPAAARNRGWRRARAPMIAFTDDDTEPHPDWLRAGLEAMRDGADAATGKIVMPLPGGEGPPSDAERDARGLQTAEFVTANCFVRRDRLEALGGFDAAFRLPWREDSDLHFRLLAAGARIVRAPRAIVSHPVRPARLGAVLAQHRRIMYDALLYRKHPRLYRERIRAAPRWDYYAIVGALAAGLLALGTGFGAAAAVLLAAWGGLTLRLFLRRLRGTRRTARDVAELALTSIAIPPLAVFWRAAGVLRFRAALL